MLLASPNLYVVSVLFHPADVRGVRARFSFLCARIKRECDTLGVSSNGARHFDKLTKSPVFALLTQWFFESQIGEQIQSIVKAPRFQAGADQHSKRFAVTESCQQDLTRLK